MESVSFRFKSGYIGAQAASDYCGDFLTCIVTLAMSSSRSRA
jgi:hypothetical protein